MTTMADLTNATPEAIADRQFEERKAFERNRRRIKRELDAEERPAHSFDFLDDAALDARPAASWLVHGVILDGSLCLTVGEPGSNKTFVMLDLALSTAAGLPTWLGRKLNRHGAVVYVAAEGQGRFKLRKNAWKQAHQITRPLPFYTLTRAIDLRDAAMMEQFLDTIRRWSPVAVFFDTLSRCIPGAEENSAKEYGEAIAACNVIQQHTGAAVFLLHHPRKDGLSARGSGVGLGAVETELWTKKSADKGFFTLTCGKQKEGDDDLVFELKRRTVELAGLYESDGEPVTSCVIELAKPADRARAEAALDRRVVECIRNNAGIKKGEVAAKLGLQKKAVNTSINSLLLSGEIVERRGGRGNKAKCLEVAAQGASAVQPSVIP